MHIVIPDDYQDVVKHLEAFERLADHEVSVYNDTATDIDTRVARFSEADVLVLIRERTPIDAELLARLPRLKLISQTGGGTAHIDVAACQRQGVKVMSGTGSPVSTAELTWALVLAATRNIPQEIENLKAGRWQRTLGTGLHGKTLGLFGYGKIGRLVAGYGQAFGMQVLVWGRETTRERARSDGIEAAVSQADFFTRSDVLSLHLRLNEETRGIVGPEDLARMPATSVLINPSRAGLLAPGALEQALRQGRPGRAAIDVFDHEPLRDDPLLALPNLVATPHLGYVERDNYELYFREAFDNVLAFAAEQG
ncbi:D-2-hydroxyacid dehydrogenase family protein [Litchfieldella xinjiangensis]|uniref:D-2-hydroxyacid dehydrogenase family protein n=1 Tax=Litchfieldella xinjiangensis TaxID=1166948 RepID=UPI0005BB22EB|nr:D-2-hydroxyacid dehydrogenase family protein [Halomonas xinjiangensis]